MQQIGKIMPKILATWGITPKAKPSDGSKYGSQNDEDIIHNSILGFVSVKDVKEAELQGAIIYLHRNWYITSEASQRETDGKPCVKASRRYLNLGSIQKEGTWLPHN